VVTPRWKSAGRISPRPNGSILAAARPRSSFRDSLRGTSPPEPLASPSRRDARSAPLVSPKRCRLMRYDFAVHAPSRPRTPTTRDPEALRHDALVYRDAEHAWLFPLDLDPSSPPSIVERLPSQAGDGLGAAFPGPAMRGVTPTAGERGGTHVRPTWRASSLTSGTGALPSARPPPPDRFPRFRSHCDAFPENGRP